MRLKSGQQKDVRMKREKQRQFQVLMLELDLSELAVRMAERASGAPRPDGATAEEALEHLGRPAQAIWMRAADEAARYFVEQLKGDGRPN